MKAILAILLFASTARAALPTYFWDVGDSLNDTGSGAFALTATSSATYTAVSGNPKAPFGSYMIRTSAGGKLNVPLAAFTAAISGDGTGSFGASFVSGEQDFALDGGLLSAVCNGKNFILYKQFGGGNRNFLLRIPLVSGGTVDYTTTAVTWQPGGMYSVWVNFAPTQLDLYMYDHNINKTWVMKSVTNTAMDFTSVTTVLAGSWSGAAFTGWFDGVWIDNDARTTWPLAGTSNWEPGVNLWTFLHYSESTATASTCSPTAATAQKQSQGYRPQFERILYNNLTVTSKYFHSLGWRYNVANDGDTPSLVFPMTECINGETSALAIAQHTASEAKSFPGGGDGLGTIYMLGQWVNDTGQTANFVQGNVTTIAETIFTAHPLASVMIVPNMLNVNSAGLTTVNIGMIAAYNATLALHPGQVSLRLDMRDVWTYPDSLCSDGVHPLKTAATSMAQDVYDALLEFVTPASVSRRILRTPFLFNIWE